MIYSFDFCLDRFISRKMTEKRSVKTIKVYSEDIDRFKRYCNSINIELDNILNINNDIVESYIKFMTYDKRKWDNHPFNKDRSTQIGLSPTSINNIRRNLNVFFTFLRSEGIINISPIQNIKSQPVDKNKFEVFTKEQVEYLLEIPNKHTFTGFRDYTIMLIMLDNGIRINELCNIKVKDINFKNQTIKINDDIAKTNKIRYIPISNKTIKHIKSLIDYCRTTEDDYLLLSIDGEQMTNNAFSKNLIKYGKKCGICGVRCSPHTFRHTFATQYLINGGDVFSLQAILGHYSLEMVSKYVHYNNIFIKNTLNKYTPVTNFKHNKKSSTEISIKKSFREPKKAVMFNSIICE